VSTRHLPYGSEFEIDYHREAQQRRVEQARKQLDPADVLSQIDDLISAEPDPQKHPCFAMVAWMLDQALTPGSGGDFWDAWKVLAWQAIDRLVEARLQGEG
jgi:hypothetical protein